MKIRIFLLFFLLVCNISQAAVVSIPTTYAVSGTVTATNLNGNFQAIASTLNGGLDNNNANTTSGYRFFEIRATLPTAGSQGRIVFLTSDNSLNIDTGSAWVKVGTSGILMPSGSVFFMITGSCPTGSTDVSSTYSNKFLKINSTAGTSSGVVLTGTTDSHVLSTAEIPAHTHTVDTNIGGSAFGSTTIANSNGATDTQRTSSSTGGGGGHTHTISTATTLEPSSVTVKACMVN